jgi:hypothetical protein
LHGRFFGFGAVYRFSGIFVIEIGIGCYPDIRLTSQTIKKFTRQLSLGEYWYANSMRPDLKRDDTGNGSPYIDKLGTFDNMRNRLLSK